MNRFRKEVATAVSKKDKTVSRVLRWSKQIQRLMGLSNEELKAAEYEGVHWYVGPWVIQVAHRTYGQWHDVLEVMPVASFESSGGRGLGWVNVSHTPLPRGWQYDSQGTGTLILPSESDRWRILIAIAKARFFGAESRTLDSGADIHNLDDYR